MIGCTANAVSQMLYIWPMENAISNALVDKPGQTGPPDPAGEVGAEDGLRQIPHDPASLNHQIRPHIRGKHRMVLIGYMQGMRYVDIAEALDIDPATVTRTLRSPIIVQEMERLVGARNEKVVDRTSEVRRRANEVMMESLDVQIGLMRHAEDERLRHMAAKEVFNFSTSEAGLGPNARDRAKPDLPRLVIHTKNVNLANIAPPVVLGEPLTTMTEVSNVEEGFHRETSKISIPPNGPVEADSEGSTCVATKPLLIEDGSS